MEKKIDLSIIILNYNTRELLKSCLHSIEQSEKNGLVIEVVVVDNASTDGSREMVEKDFDWVRLIKSSSNLGFAKGNNLGLPEAGGRYLLFLNSDTVVPTKIFPELISFLDGNKDIGALTVRLVLRSGQMDPDCHRGFPTPWASLTYFVGLENFFPKSRLLGQYHQFYLDLEKIHEIDSACGAFLLVRREAVKEINGFDESYFFYGEDIDFCYRLGNKGWKILYYPRIEVLHYKGASSGLREETQDITQADKQTRIKAARASIEAMKIFYDKFYRLKYSRWFTWLVILGIQIKGWFRLLLHFLKR